MTPREARRLASSFLQSVDISWESVQGIAEAAFPPFRKENRYGYAEGHTGMARRPVRVVVAPGDGYLKQSHVRPGDTVKAGHLLAEM